VDNPVILPLSIVRYETPSKPMACGGTGALGYPALLPSSLFCHHGDVHFTTDQPAQPDPFIEFFQEPCFYGRYLSVHSLEKTGLPRFLFSAAHLHPLPGSPVFMPAQDNLSGID
jgi:hypothetical protein